MDSRTVNKEIRKCIRPLLKSHGFIEFTERSAWRHRSGCIDVVNFQSFNDYLATGIGCTSYSFALNLGIYLTCVPSDDKNIKYRRERLAPLEWQCHRRSHLKRTINQPELHRNDIWYVDPDGKYLSPVISDVHNVLLDIGFPWFDAKSSYANLLKELIETMHSPDSPMDITNGSSTAREEMIGYLSWSIGDIKTAFECLRRVLEDRIKMNAILCSPRSKWRPPPMTKLEADVKTLHDLNVNVV